MTALAIGIVLGSTRGRSSLMPIGRTSSPVIGSYFGTGGLFGSCSSAKPRISSGSSPTWAKVACVGRRSMSLPYVVDPLLGEVRCSSARRLQLLALVFRADLVRPLRRQVLEIAEQRDVHQLPRRMGTASTYRPGRR
jgi:hypothetical protein